MNTPKEPTFEVTLLKDGHVHQQKPCKTGDKINVTASQAAFLADAGLINKPGATAAKGKE